MEEQVVEIDEKVEVKPVEMTGSQALVESMLHAGTRLIFGYPGGAIMPVYDALYLHGEKIRHILDTP